MKELILCNGDDGFIIEEVNARMCKYASNCFIFKDEEHYRWNLTDRATGLRICSGRTLKQLEENFSDHMEMYESYRKTDKYKIKVERFEKMKLVNNYSKGDN